MTRIRTRKHYLTTAKRADKASRQRYVKGQLFVDPFPNVHGTLPEKVVYAELSRRGIPFYFLNDFDYSIPELDLVKTFQSDFRIPSLKIIIEVQGSYWHSMEKAIEADAFKAAIYEMSGWKVLSWWDYDILSRLHTLFAQEPDFAQYQPQQTGSSELAVVSRVKQDTSQGIRTLNYKRQLRNSYKKPAIRLKTRRT